MLNGAQWKLYFSFWHLMNKYNISLGPIIFWYFIIKIHYIANRGYLCEPLWVNVHLGLCKISEFYILSFWSLWNVIAIEIFRYSKLLLNKKEVNTTTFWNSNMFFNRYVFQQNFNRIYSDCTSNFTSCSFHPMISVDHNAKRLRSSKL